MLKQIAPTILLFTVLFASSCALTQEGEVRSAFQKDHPNYAIIYVGGPDGHSNSDVVTFFIRYKKLGDEREYWADWAYRTNAHEFELVGKGEEHVYEALTK